MTSSPRVTLGMPVYNGAAVMTRAIDSLLSQTFGDFELVISDNASTDRTVEIATSYAEKDSRVRLVSSQVKRGASWNFNHVFRQATGEYFVWTAADDSWDPRYIEACVVELDAYSEAVACVSHIQPVTSTGRPIGRPYGGMAIRGASVRSRWRAALRNSLLHSATYGVMRREAIGRTRMLPPYVGSDHVFMTQVALQGQVLEIAETLCYKQVPDEGEVYKSHLELLRYLGGTGGAPWLIWLRMTKELVVSPFHVRPEGAPLLLLSVDAAASYFSTGGWRNDGKRAVIRIRDAARSRTR